MTLLLAALSGLMAGLASALLGIGGGVILVPMLLYFVVPDIKVAIGTSLAYIAPIALSGALQHGWRGQISWVALAACVPLGLAGTYLGAELSDLTPNLALKRIFGVLMIIAGLKMVLSFGPTPDEEPPVPEVDSPAVAAENVEQQEGGE